MWSQEEHKVENALPPHSSLPGSQAEGFSPVGCLAAKSKFHPNERPMRRWWHFLEGRWRAISSGQAWHNPGTMTINARRKT